MDIKVAVVFFLAFLLPGLFPVCGSAAANPVALPEAAPVKKTFGINVGFSQGVENVDKPVKGFNLIGASWTRSGTDKGWDTVTGFDFILLGASNLAGARSVFAISMPVTVRYSFIPDKAFTPYLGAGLGLNWIGTSTEVLQPDLSTETKVNSVKGLGLIGSGGFVWNFGNWHLGSEVRYQSYGAGFSSWGLLTKVAWGYGRKKNKK